MAADEDSGAGFLSWKYAHHFSFLSVKDKNIVVNCTLCGGSKTLSTSKTSNSNLMKHLQKQQASTKLVEKDPKRNVAVGDTSSADASPAKQPKLDFTKPAAQSLTQPQLHRLIARYVVEDMKPINRHTPTMTKTLGEKNGLQILDGVPDAVVKAVKTRFAHVLGSEDVLLAAVTLPKFKLHWLHDQARKDLAKAHLLAECRKLLPKHDQLQPGTCATNTAQGPGSSKEDEFFSFAESDDTYATAEAEVAEYLTSGATGLDSLKHFPLIKKLSLKLNAATPSSAPVERLFSLGNLTLTPKRNKLSDRKFEKLLLMRYNCWFEGTSVD